MDLSGIRLLVLDVDGVLTPGDVVFDDSTSRIMSFDIHDGYAMTLWRKAGHQAAVLSGRRSTIVERRACEMGIVVVRQGVGDKGAGFRSVLEELQTPAEAACYVGDDLPDVPAMRASGFAVAVANAMPAVKRAADYVTRRGGGRGAVAEVIELILRWQKRWGGPDGER